MAKATPISHHLGPRKVGRVEMTAEDAKEFNLGNLSQLSALGLGLSEAGVRKMAIALDAAPDLINGGQSNAPYVHYLRNFLPGVVGTLTQARKIDEFVGISVAGDWSDEEVVQETMTFVGSSQPYTDKGNIPMASYNFGYETRGVFRSELGFSMDRLESARADRMRANAAARKRNSVANALDYTRNLIGFYGYNGAAHPIYGFLNDPNLPAYTTVAPTGAGNATEWSTKGFISITGDIREAVAELTTNLKGNFNARTERWTLGLPTSRTAYLTVTNEFGQSVESWFKATYPNARIVDAPELDTANGNEAVLYVYPERLEGDDGSDDNRRVFDQIVQTQFLQLGVEQGAKGYVEDFTNSTSGVMAKRPMAVVRRTGI